MSEKEYKRKSELMFEKNTILINQLEQAKGIIREFLHNRKTPYLEGELDLFEKAETFLKEQTDENN